jgi:hypothetical protein
MSQKEALTIFSLKSDFKAYFTSIPFGKYQRYSITFGYYNDSFWKLCSTKKDGKRPRT